MSLSDTKFDSSTQIHLWMLALLHFLVTREEWCVKAGGKYLMSCRGDIKMFRDALVSFSLAVSNNISQRNWRSDYTSSTFASGLKRGAHWTLQLVHGHFKTL